MQTEVAEKFYTVKQYLAFEERAKDKHEYYNGKIIKMPGASYRHNQIAANIIAALIIALYDKSFIVTTNDTKIHIPQYDSFVYPDAVVVFEKPEFYANRNDVIVNPLLIVEIVSPSTKKHDRTLKFQEYKSLPSFKEYVMVEQAHPWIVASHKIADRTWKDAEANAIEDTIYLQSVDCTLELQKIYRGVQFDKPIK